MSGQEGPITCSLFITKTTTLFQSSALQRGGDPTGPQLLHQLGPADVLLAVQHGSRGQDHHSEWRAGSGGRPALCVCVMVKVSEQLFDGGFNIPLDTLATVQWITVCWPAMYGPCCLQSRVITLDMMERNLVWFNRISELIFFFPSTKETGHSRNSPFRTTSLSSLVENNHVCFSVILVFSGKDCCKGILRPFFPLRICLSKWFQRPNLYLFTFLNNKGKQLPGI